MKFKMKLAVTALFTISLPPVAAHAATITFTLSNPNQYISLLGGSLTYGATVSAPASNSGSVFLNGDSFNVTAPVTLDDSDFLVKFPLSLATGTSFTGDLFVLTMPPNPPPGTYLGTFTLLGGVDGNANDTLGTVNFSLTTPIPEPSSIVLLISGLAITLLWAAFKGNPRPWAR